MPTPQEPWRDRVWREFRAGNFTRAMRDVLLTLATYRGPGGIAWPSHATLAERAKCSVRTVQRALAMAAELGLTQAGERVLIIAGPPMGAPGAANLLRVTHAPKLRG